MDTQQTHLKSTKLGTGLVDLVKGSHLFPELPELPVYSLDLTGVLPDTSSRRLEVLDRGKKSPRGRLVLAQEVGKARGSGGRGPKEEAEDTANATWRKGIPKEKEKRRDTNLPSTDGAENRLLLDHLDGRGGSGRGGNGRVTTDHPSKDRGGNGTAGKEVEHDVWLGLVLSGLVGEERGEEGKRGDEPASSISTSVGFTLTHGAAVMREKSAESLYEFRVFPP
jgi:hypothetical protein